MVRDMMLTMDEYLAIRRLIESERESEGSSLANTEQPKKRRRVSKYQRTFGRNLRQLDSMKRLKNGSYKSGWDRSKILSKAHKMTRKELGMR
jgi:hypothetical protein